MHMHIFSMKNVIIIDHLLKKLTLFFLLNPVPFDGQSYQIQKESKTSEQLLFWLQDKFEKVPLFVMYYLTKFDDVV